MTKKSTLPSLEDSLTEISQLIEKMEHSEQTLEHSLNHFERGITLVKHCQKILTEAEQKVQLLIQSNQKESLTNYGDDANNTGSDLNDDQST